MARLLSAQGCTSLQHLLEYVFVANVRAQHADAGVLECDFQSHVRHRSGDYSVALQLALGAHVAGCGKEHSVSVDNTTACVAEESAVGVAVERDSEIKLAV